MAVATADLYEEGLGHRSNRKPDPFEKGRSRRHEFPQRGCWANGYVAGRKGLGMEACTYKKHSDHGGTWGYQANAAWMDGWRQGREERVRT